MKRQLTVSEAKFLHPIFGATLPYRRIKCDINSHNVGGENNSITPTGNPFFSVHDYCNDFAADGVSPYQKWVFVHELTHVWQYYHEVNVCFSALGLWISHRACYEKAYPYSLKESKTFAQFNIEQQASIIADYWVLTQLKKPYMNVDKSPSVADYAPCIERLRQAGPPHIPSFEDYDQNWTRRE